MAIEAAGFLGGRSRSAAARDGAQTLARADARNLSAAGRRHGRQRHRSRRGRAAVPHARRLCRLRVSRIARRKFCAAGVRVGLREMPFSGDLRGGDSQRAADGILFDRSAGQRRAAARRRRQTGGSQRERVLVVRRYERRAAAGVSSRARTRRSAEEAAGSRARRRRLCGYARLRAANAAWKKKRWRIWRSPARLRPGSHRGAKRCGRCARSTNAKRAANSAS